MTAGTFKVIVVGGGPIGLTAAHALVRAGIDFVLLERRDSVVVDVGYNVILNPQGLRPLSQLNLLDELKKHGTNVLDVSRFDHSGRDIGSLYFLHSTREYFGICPQNISRHNLTSVLYEALPLEIKDNLLVNKKLSAIKSTPEGMEVLCEDGTSYSGDLIIGADGAHSTVRQSMRALALESGSAQADDDEPFLTTYRCLWIRFPTSSYPGFTTSFVAETHGPGASTQMFVGTEMGIVGVYERLETPTTERLRATQADQDAVVERWGFLPIAKGGAYTVRQAYEQRLQAGMVSLEEGVMKQWSWDGRIVLVGDAAHKFTPSTGAGLNHGISDVVCLANALKKTLDSSAGRPSGEQVAEVLQTYHDQRYEDVRAACAESSNLTSLSMWTTTIHWLFDRCLMFSFVQRALGGPQNSMHRLFAASPVFDYIAAKDQFLGTVPWRHAFPTEGAEI